ncbi:DNA alkylation repair protein [Pseudobacter ginsenosidimutans]|nr:DNA alkylation repair protein [Pseudobacter ginsenosidimutans]QEC45264.1 DNA alkylation repair protein [Pseudobacter ginsenosidimutans]
MAKTVKVKKATTVKKTVAKKTPAKSLTKKTKPKATAEKSSTSNNEFTAKAFVSELNKLQSDEELRKIQRYFKSGEGEYGEGDQFMGVKMGNLFSLAKTFIDMPPDQLEILMESPIHEHRAGAMSIMDKQGRSNKTSPRRRKELYQLYLRRHDRINNWDLVDLAAQYVVGRYLDDQPKNVLYKLAVSKNIWERRTAIVASVYFLRKKQTDDTFRIAEMMVNDKEDLIQKAAGGWIREAGKQDPKRLIAFLDKHAATLPRTFLRYAIEKLPAKQKEYYMKLGKK